MSEKQYDLVVLGGGTAGYVAAIRASQLGKKVAIVERQLLGGTCLHKGCIPTKSLLKSAEVFQTVKQAAMFGVDVKDANVNFENMLARKEDIINQMYQGVKHLMQHNHIDIYNGTGRILGTSIFSPQSGTISVEYEDGESDLLPNQFVLIATGSSPAELPFLSFDHDKILSSDDILSLKTLPSSVGIIGGGVIGMEFASLMIDLGVDVTVIEAGERILPTESKQASQLLKKSLSARGVKFYEGIKLSENDINVNEDGVTFEISSDIIKVDKVLLSIGRKPNTSDIGLNNTKIKLSTSGHAAGDCIGKLQLAHVGSKEGVVAVDHMFEGNPIPVNYNMMPKCIYSQPEIASIGLNIEQAKAEGMKVKSFKVPFKAIGKAVIDSHDANEGYSEMVIDQSTEEIVGINMIGPHVTELINEASLLQFMNGSALELGLTTHAHPSISEVLMELGLKAESRAIHV